MPRIIFRKWRASYIWPSPPTSQIPLLSPVLPLLRVTYAIKPKNKDHLFLNLLYQMAQARHHFDGHQTYIRSKMRTSTEPLISCTRDTSLEHKNNGNCKHKSYADKLIVSNYVEGSINNYWLQDVLAMYVGLCQLPANRILHTADEGLHRWNILQLVFNDIATQLLQSIQLPTLKSVAMSLYNIIVGRNVYRETNRQSDKWQSVEHY